jgi:ribosome-binding ATPase YchF (GTP1/OBG family)
MKISFTGLNIQEGKIKYQDPVLAELSNKDKPKKISPFFVEFLKDKHDTSEAIIINKTNLLDIIIHDMEKIEVRINRSTDDSEINLLKKCLSHLEEEKPLCNMKYSNEEKEFLKTLSFYSYKPVIQIDDTLNMNNVIEIILEKTANMFFYTSGPSESHAWLVPLNSDIVTCASKIHSDLARGFIKGDVVSYENYMNCHNFNECKSKGLAKMVDRDYIVQPNEIIEIRFNV